MFVYNQSRPRKVDGCVLRERDDQLMRTENVTLTETRLFENDTVNDIKEVGPSNDEDAEDNSEPPHTLAHSNTTCEGLKLKTGQVVTYTDSGSVQAHTGKILSRAEMSTGTYKNWYNLQYTEAEEIAGTTGSADLGQVDNLQLGPTEHDELCADATKKTN